MATKAHLVIDGGSTFSVTLDLTDENTDPVALAGYTATAQMRKWYSSSNVAATFTTSINPDTSEITLSLTAEETGAIVGGRYVYDVELDNGAGVISRLVEGIVTVTPQVTR